LRLNEKFIIISFIFILISSNAIAAKINTPINPQHYQELIGVGIDVNWVMFDKIMSAYKSAQAELYKIHIFFFKESKYFIFHKC
jgi:hypothetical protein